MVPATEAANSFMSSRLASAGQKCLERAHDGGPAVMLVDVLQSLPADLTRHVRSIHELPQRGDELCRVAVEQPTVRPQHLALEHATTSVHERGQRVIPSFEQRD